MSCVHHENHSCIHRVPIFEQLTDQEIEVVAAAVQSRRYRKGELIFHEGERSDQLYIVNEGILKLSKLSDEGKEQIIRFLFPGDFFGQFALLQEKKHYANAEVLSPAIICTIHKQDFQPIMEQNARMAYRFLLAVSERLAQADDWMGTLSLMETDRRLAKLLMLFYERNHAQAEIVLPVQKKELAALLGTTPETLSRKLASLESQGLLTVTRGSVIIHQPQRLSELAG